MRVGDVFAPIGIKLPYPGSMPDNRIPSRVPFLRRRVTPEKVPGKAPDPQQLPGFESPQH